MARIFISYKRVDKEKVFKVKDQIESALGEKCWIDLDGIESDAQFKNVIIRAINECEIVLFMYSNAHSKIVDFEKDWTVRELDYAQDKGKRIVFINIDGSPLTDEFKFDFGRKQHVDGRSAESIGLLCKDLKLWKYQPNIRTSRSTNGTKYWLKWIYYILLPMVFLIPSTVFLLNKLKPSVASNSVLEAEKSPNTLELDDLISTYLKAINEDYCPPWNLFSNNNAIVPIKYLEDSDRFDNFEFAIVFQYKGKLQYKNNPLMVDAMDLPLTWDIKLYGSHAGVDLIEFDSGHQLGHATPSFDINNIAKVLGFVVKEDYMEFGELRTSYQKENVMIFVTAGGGSGGSHYNIIITNYLQDNPHWEHLELPCIED